MNIQRFDNNKTEYQSGKELVTSVSKWVLFLLSLPIFGAIGFMEIENWSFFESFYMAIITLTTVGYQEVHPLSEYGRGFVIFLLVTGLGTFLFSVTQLSQIIISPEFRRYFGGKKMRNIIEKMDQHYIVCGFGRMGEKVCESLEKRNISFVVIDQQRTKIDICNERGWPNICGDVTDDDVLHKAKVSNASGMAIALDEDSSNVFVCLSARILNPEIQIIARASSEAGSKKMRRAGADKVVNIHDTGANKMAELMTNTKLSDFVELFKDANSELDLADIPILQGSPYIGKTCLASGIMGKNVTIVGVRAADGQLLSKDPEDKVIEANDSILLVGNRQAIQEFAQNC
jgi:voltage-gated potassium channel